MDLAATKNTTSTTIIDELFVYLDSPIFPILVAIENSIPKTYPFCKLALIATSYKKNTKNIAIG
jgi:hypothetical protein